MSMGGAMETSAAPTAGADADLSAMTEEEQIAYAIRMSMADSAPAAAEASTETPMEDGQ